MGRVKKMKRYEPKFQQASVRHYNAEKNTVFTSFSDLPPVAQYFYLNEATCLDVYKNDAEILRGKNKSLQSIANHLGLSKTHVFLMLKVKHSAEILV